VEKAVVVAYFKARKTSGRMADLRSRFETGTSVTGHTRAEHPAAMFRGGEVNHA
jgi:hypothetical protein